MWENHQIRIYSWTRLRSRERGKYVVLQLCRINNVIADLNMLKPEGILKHQTKTGLFEIWAIVSFTRRMFEAFILWSCLIVSCSRLFLVFPISVPVFWSELNFSPRARVLRRSRFFLLLLLLVTEGCNDLERGWNIEFPFIEALNCF